jgi:hypothetical protein
VLCVSAAQVAHAEWIQFGTVLCVTDHSVNPLSGQGDNYFEIDVDVGSSSVARNVVGLAIGYSKAIVVDMGFCLQVGPLQ